MAAAALQAVGSIVQGTAAYQAGKYNKKLAYVQAVEQERDGVATEARIRDTARQAIGAQLAAQGASGFEMGSGSALDGLMQSQINATLDGLTARREAAAKARGTRLEGDQAMSAGKNAYTAGLFQVASQAVDWGSTKSSSGGATGSSGGGAS